MATRTPWTDQEQAAVVALYFYMLGQAQLGQPYNKAQLIRNSQTGDPSKPLEARTRGSIEAKLMNCSAAHRDIAPGAETMATHGYKAWGNYQASLKDAMAKEMATRGAHRDDAANYYAKQAQA